MSIPASQIFEFIDRELNCSLERYEMRSTTFGVLRRGLRSVSRQLAEVDEGATQDLAEKLRAILSEWLTSPVSFDGSMLEAVSSLGDPGTVEIRWGRDIRGSYDLALQAARDIQGTENPIRGKLHETIEKLLTHRKNFRIYCSRRARNHFESIFLKVYLPPHCFLHSVSDYRETEPFDVLIKVGPLRSRGWGSAPDALVSAPRFRALVQIVWSGCADEQDFGYDPVARFGAEVTAQNSHAVGTAMVWERNTTLFGHDESAREDAFPDIDELEFFSRTRRPGTYRRATLVEIDEDHGILYPPQSQVASFDPASMAKPFAYRIPEETLSEGMLVFRPILADADLGALHADDGYYARVWKERLRGELTSNTTQVMERLRSAGIDLQNLQTNIRRWCRVSSTVIHAPQQRKHFEILIKVLGITHDSQKLPRRAHLEWWQCAWAEITRSRGEAIQTGLQEQEIIYEELFSVLEDMLPTIRQHSAARQGFEIEIPSGRSLTGTVRFYFVRSIEDSFLAPGNMLETICDLETLEQWRA